ncbi:MAG: hypothetical protein F4X51_00065 [Gemmatimonadetes bacterium]|nr:hypothetical protein [Gemmatimonadota bacterium]
MPGNKPKYFTFWRARFSKEDYRQNTKELFLRAFGEDSTVETNWSFENEKNPTYQNYHGLINHRAEYRGFFCADFCSYEKGKKQHIIKPPDRNEELEYKEVSAPQADDGTDQEYIDGNLYLVCTGNNLVISQSNNLRTKQLEVYLNGIFHEQDLISDDIKIILQRPFARSLDDALLRGIKRINLSTNLEQEEAAGSNRIQDLANVIFGNLSAKNQFNTDSITGKKGLRADVSFVFDKRTLKDEAGIIDTLGNTFRFVDDELNVSIETANGTWMRNKDLLLRTTEQVLYDDDGMPNRKDIFHKMIDWYLRLESNEQI